MKNSKAKIKKAKKNLSDKKIYVVSTYWNEEIIEPMLKDCSDELIKSGLEPISIKVPGAYELPFLASAVSEKCDLIILLGCIIKGATPHFEIISQSISDAVLNVSLSKNIPIIFGVLTTNTSAEARERAEYNGAEYALSALNMLENLSEISEK